MADTHAVVIGGSLAGLCAARVLADHVDQVTIVDRDACPQGAFERAGVAQGRHPHALLARGLREIEALFPGFEGSMRQRGALAIDFGLAFAALRPVGWQPRVASGFAAIFASRLLLESVVRELFDGLPNVTLRERTEVKGLHATRGNGALRIGGVHVRDRDGGALSTLAADLVVDASGRTSKAPEWLGTLGLTPPPDTVVDAFMGYSTRWYRLPDPWPREWWWRGIWIDPVDPDRQHAGVLFPVEDGRGIVTVAGVSKHYPPADEAGFLAALAGLRSPILAEAVALSEPVSDIYCHRAMANRHRHYERWTAAPAGFLAIGDAVSAFNPVYGQGMSVAAACARILDETLTTNGPTSAELPCRFFAAQAPFVQDVWGMATGAEIGRAHV